MYFQIKILLNIYYIQTSTTTVAATSSLSGDAERVSFVKLSAKKSCEYKNGCPFLATHNCHMCSTFHCDLHVSRHFDESHNIDLSRNELQWFLFAAVGKTLGIHCIYNAVEGQCDLLAHQLCIICEMAFCSAHSYSHDCIGTHHSHANPLKYEEFDCQHCLIRFKEYSSTQRYADFTQKLHFFEGFSSKKNRKKMLKMKKKILPTCIPCERRVSLQYCKHPSFFPT